MDNIEELPNSYTQKSHSSAAIRENVVLIAASRAKERREYKFPVSGGAGQPAETLIEDSNKPFRREVSSRTWRMSKKEDMMSTNKAMYKVFIRTRALPRSFRAQFY